MEILTRIYTALLSVFTQPERYSTIVYPTRGQGVIVHDGWGIHQERPWYRQPVVEQAQSHSQPDSIPVSSKQAASPALFEDFTTEDIAFSSGCAATQDVFDDSAHYSPVHSEDIFSSGIGGFFGTGACMDFNPASGLPMMDSCFDVGGNTFGFSS